MALPLSVLLSHALVALKEEFERAGAGTDTLPSLPVWSDVLRLVGDDGVDVLEMPRLARLSRRTMKVAVDRVVQAGWAVTAKDSAPRSPKVVRLTEQGREARDAWEPVNAAVEHAWRKQLGDIRFDALRASLEALVSQLHLELPHFPASYGPSDPSITGGIYTQASAAGDVPPHGQDWPVVLRGEGDTVSPLPLAALLSQALVAFAIDYECDAHMGLAQSANILRLIDDDGVALDDLPALAGVGVEAVAIGPL